MGLGKLTGLNLGTEASGHIVEDRIGLENQQTLWQF